MSSKSKYQFYQEASLSQKLADKDPIYQKLAGSNPAISRAIAALTVMCEVGIISENDPDIALTLRLLDAQRKADFATSEKTDQITKMGLQMPKGEDEISTF